VPGPPIVLVRVELLQPPGTLAAYGESVSAVRSEPGDRNLLVGGIDGDRALLGLFESCEYSQIGSGVGRTGDHEILARFEGRDEDGGVAECIGGEVASRWSDIGGGEVGQAARAALSVAGVACERRSTVRATGGVVGERITAGRAQHDHCCNNPYASR
jgi:hypothetical protein